MHERGKFSHKRERARITNTFSRLFRSKGETAPKAQEDVLLTLSQEAVSAKQTEHSRIDNWKHGLYNSPLSDYEVTFDKVLSESGSIPDLLEGKKEPFVVDLMAPSGTLADFFRHQPEDFSGRGIAFSSTDERTPHQQERDQRLGIDQVAGDITKVEDRQKVEEKFAGKKVDLFMMRPHGARDVFAKDPQVYSDTVQWVWRHLSNDNGNALLQTHKELPLETWKPALEAQGVEVYVDRVGNYGMMRLVKKSDSPHILQLPK